MSALAPHIEAAALRETEDALRDLVRVAQNVGCGNPSLAMMLRAVAEELAPTTIIHGEPALPQ